jgi:hypothetical protein
VLRMPETDWPDPVPDFAGLIDFLRGLAPR